MDRDKTVLESKERTLVVPFNMNNRLFKIQANK